MPKFYGTFRFADATNRSKFVVIEAEDYETAKAKMFEAFGDDWSMLYNERQFIGHPDKYGLTELKIR